MSTILDATCTFVVSNGFPLILCRKRARWKDGAGYFCNEHVTLGVYGLTVWMDEVLGHA